MADSDHYMSRAKPRSRLFAFPVVFGGGCLVARTGAQSWGEGLYIALLFECRRTKLVRQLTPKVHGAWHCLNHELLDFAAYLRLHLLTTHFMLQ